MAEQTLIRAVDASLRKIKAGDSADAALRALARRYARLIDGAADLAEDLANAPTPDDGNERQALEALRRRAGEVETARDLGPKLLTTLQALGIGNVAAAAPPAAKAPTGTAAVDALERLRRRKLSAG